MRLATYASVSTALLLVLVKSIAWSMSGSVSMLATLVDSCMDGLASLGNLLAVRHALSPADREHRFGHGKAEALSGLGQSLLVAGSALYLLVEAAQRLSAPVSPQAPLIGVLVMLFSIAVSLLLVSFQRHVVKRTGSTAVGADALHYRADLLVNTGVIVALVLAHRGWPAVDAIFALLIALYILYSAWGILRGSLDHLMDRELPDEERQAIREIVLGHPEVRGMHDLRTRRSGIDTFLQLHLELDDHLKLLHAHRISDEVQARLLVAFPDAEVIIHNDPLSIVPHEAPPPYVEGGGRN